MGARNKQKPRQCRYTISEMATDELIFTAAGLGKKEQH